MGNIVTYDLFTSATYGDKDVVIGNKGNVRLIIHTRTGKKIDMISNAPNEFEILFSRDKRFYVEDRVDKMETEEYIEIILREID